MFQSWFNNMIKVLYDGKCGLCNKEISYYKKIANDKKFKWLDIANNPKDLREFNVTGKDAESSLVRANITCNKNGIPFDSESPMITSGIRLGSQAATTRGFGLKEFQIVGDLITKTIKGLAENPEDNSKTEDEVRKEVVSLCSNFPIYKHLG